MKILFVVLLLQSAANCQEEDEHRFLAKIPTGMSFLPKDFLRPALLKPQPFNLLPKIIDYSLPMLPGKTTPVSIYGHQTPETIKILSSQAITANLSVIRRNSYIPRREGSFSARFWHALRGGVTSLGEYNAAANYYRFSKPPNLFNPKELYHYERSKDPVYWLIRQLINSWKRTVLREFGTDINIIRLVLHKK